MERVELNVTRRQVEVHVEHATGQRFACPEYGREQGVYGHLAERLWRHLDSYQFLIHLHAWAPRVSCPEHGVHQMVLPWAQAGSRFTHLFMAPAIEVLRAADVKHAASILCITWDEAWYLMKRAVMRGQAAKGSPMPRRIGVDKNAIAKEHRYMTLVCDLQADTVEYIGEDRKQTSLAAYFDAFLFESRAQLEAISLDLWPQPSSTPAGTRFPTSITSAVAEGLNSKIATVQKRACGYNNPNNFKTAVYFHCGGLNPYPISAIPTKVR